MPSFDITEIPKVMRTRGWHRIARLLQQWFSQPANENAEHGLVDTNTINLEWVLQRSHRARDAFSEIFVIETHDTFNIMP